MLRQRKQKERVQQGNIFGSFSQLINSKHIPHSNLFFFSIISPTSSFRSFCSSSSLLSIITTSSLSSLSSSPSCSLFPRTFSFLSLCSFSSSSFSMRTTTSSFCSFFPLFDFLFPSSPPPLFTTSLFLFPLPLIFFLIAKNKKQIKKRLSKEKQNILVREKTKKTMKERKIERMGVEELRSEKEQKKNKHKKFFASFPKERIQKGFPKITKKK